LIGSANKNIVPAEDLDRDYKVYPKIDWDKCIGCGRCYVSCFDGAHQAITWDPKTRRPSVDTSKCVGCHLCNLVCPVGAITTGEKVMKPGRKGNAEDKQVESVRLTHF
jgi:dihydropyrimidine dehydrogenase (NAD+) subunit PreA